MSNQITTETNKAIQFGTMVHELLLEEDELEPEDFAGLEAKYRKYLKRKSERHVKRQKQGRLSDYYDR
jgi:hypothetical protein